MAREDRWGGGGGAPQGNPAAGLGVAGATLGFALGGFLDGILLHQILQWHHVLDGLDGPSWRSLRVQVLADGLFHALMYVIALAGLVMLWRARHATVHVAGRRFLGAVLAGAGLWHVADGVLSHWLLGLHHVRMAADSVLLWDMVFFLAGLLLLVAGSALWRAPQDNGDGPGVSTRNRPSGRTAFMVALTVGAAGAWAGQPAPGGLVTAVFPADAAPQAPLRAAGAVAARVVWVDPAGSVAVFALTGGAPDAWRLYGAGAQFVSGATLSSGCFARTRIS